MTLGVKVLVENGRGEVLLERLSYASGWHLPGGGVETGETAAEAARRELMEECRLVIAALTLLAVFYHPSEGQEDHVVAFHAQLPDGMEATPDHDEVLEVRWVSAATLPPDASPGTRKLLTAFWARRPYDERW